MRVVGVGESEDGCGRGGINITVKTTNLKM